MSRCYNENDKDYPKVGGQGIRVCPQWHDYDIFLQDMGDKPEDSLLRRKDLKKDFSPDNVYWDAKVNARTNRVYGIWKEMRRRCGVIGNPDEFATYQKRGIDVCPEWADSFKTFYEHVGEPPSKEHSLDRIDNDKGYWPGNVRWADKKQQANNRCDNVVIEMNGERKTLQQWCDHFGLNRNVVSSRWANLFKKARKKEKRCVQIDIATEQTIAVFDSAKEAADQTGIGYAAITKCASGASYSAGGYFWRYEI